MPLDTTGTTKDGALRVWWIQLQDLRRWLHGETLFAGAYRWTAALLLAGWLLIHLFNAIQTGNWHAEMCRMSIDPTSKDCR